MVQILLSRVSQWGLNNNLKFSAKKTLLLPLFRTHSLPTTLNILASSIKEVDHIKILGVTFDSNLSRNHLVTYACAGVNYIAQIITVTAARLKGKVQQVRYYNMYD